MKHLWLVFALLLAGCARTSPPVTRSQSDADQAFARLANEYLTGYLAWRPQTGTSLGFHQYDGKVTDFSQSSLAAELTRLKAFDQRLSRLASSQLSPAAFYDYRILRGAVQREIFGFDSAQVYTRNPMTYAGVLDVNIYIKRNFAPLPDRVRSLTAILNQAPAITAAAHSNLAVELPRPLVETAIEQAEGSADFLAKDLVEALKDVKDERLMAEFKLADAQAIREMRNYAAYLKTEKLPKSNDAYALGREKYAKLLQYGEMITLTPDEILEIGLRELHRQQDSFAAAAKQIDPGKPPLEVFKAIQKEHPSAARLIPDTAQGLEAIRQFVVDHHVITIPSRVRAQVAETPQFLRATSFASMDTPGPFERKATEAFYYVTPVEPDWSPRQQEEWLTAFNYYDIAITSVHEAYPGHYVQFLCLNASPATKLEKIFGGYAFTEGWAHYCEEMMLEQGFGGGGASASQDQQIAAAKYRMAQADEALLRVCRLCVSIKLHCSGMSVDEATRFFQDNCYYEEKPARQEAIRGTFDPEYLYYTIGKLEILKLREDCRKQEGSRFSLEGFHDDLLRHGAPPLRLLRELMLKDRNTWDQVL
jgi:uncharacterized protein (DUF885 family)